MHLAIDAPNWVGDLCMATPVLEEALRAPHFARVSILVREHLAPLLADGPAAPNLVAVAGAADESARLRDLRPDAVLLLTNSFGAAWRAWRCGVKLRFGAALQGRGWLLTHAVLPPSRRGARFPIPSAHLLRDVAALAGIHARSLRPRLDLGDAARAKLRAALIERGWAESEPIAVCAPGAAFGRAKLYPPQSLALALDRICRNHGLRPVIWGGPGEEPLMQAVAQASQSRPISLASAARDLSTLKALVEGAALVLVGDSGPRWVAAAFGTPCVSILGPNIPQLTATSLEQCEIVRLEDLECSPCARRTCPLGHHRCMRELPPERVVEAAARVLSRKGAA
jgi:heptosyltransferase-2